MAEFDLGRAKGEIELGYNPAGAARAKEDLAGMERGAKRGAGPALSQLGRTAMVAGAGIAAGLALAVNAAANFEQRLSGIQAVSGATGAEMEAVRKKALKLGADTKYSAAEAAQAIEELSKAGISLPDILNGAADATVALAAAGEIDLPRAAEIAANAMNTFGLKASELPRVADLVAGAANASAISVEEFAQSMQQGGAAAQLAGISFDDLATSIALMGNAGIKGSDAGTSLKTFLLSLNPIAAKQSDLMKKLGIITKEGGNQFFNAAGKAKSMSEIAGVLENSLKGMTQQQKLSTLQTLFGSDAIRAAAVISNSGSKGFDNMAAAMGKVKAADVAAQRMNNLKGQIEQMKGSLETAAIIIGTILIPVLTTLTKKVTGVINAFASLSPQTQKTATTIALVAGAFLLIVGVALKVIMVARSLAAAFQLMWVSALGPVALVIALIVAVAAVMYILYKRVQPVHDAIDALGRILLQAFNGVKPVLAIVAAGFINFMNVLRGGENSGSGFIRVMGTIAAVLRDVIIPALIATGKWLLATFGPILSQIISIVSGFVTSIIAYFRSIQPQLTTIMNAIIAIIRFTFNLLAPIIVPILRFILSFVMDTLKLLAIGIRVLLAGIANIFRGVFNIIGGIIKVFLSVLTGNWGAAWNGVKQIVKGVLQIILGIIQAIIGVAIIAIVVTSVKAIGSVFRAGFNAVRSIVTGSINAVRAVISGGMAAARAVVSAAVSVIRAAFTGNLGALGGIARAALAAVRNAFSSGLAAARSIVSGGLNGIVSAVQALGSRMFSAGAEIMGRLASGITSRAAAAVNAVKDAVSRAMSFLPGSPVKEGPARVLNNGGAGKKIIDMVISGINARKSELAAAMRGVAVPVGEAVSTVPVALAGSASRSARVGATTAAGSQPLDTSGIADAVKRGLTDARFQMDRDGLARIVTGSLTPYFATGGRA